MPESLELISVCVCTYKRPHLLRNLLEELVKQETGDLFKFCVVIVDNDKERSAEAMVTEFARGSKVDIAYWVEPVANIAMARNKVVKEAKGDYLAFIDDDEFPVKDWLRNMLSTCKQPGVSGVLGPVLPHFETGTPTWVVKAGFYDRRRHPTGFVLGWQEARTGNVLLKRSILDGVEEVFRPQFGSGGEDQDFFRRMMGQGHTFVWCDEGPAYETVPPQRCKRGFLIHRALHRGTINSKHSENRWRNITKSIVAVPLYTVALPFLCLRGHHLFMKYLVRLCDHVGRLLALLHLNPITERKH